MRFEDFKVLANDWKVAIETTNYDLCKKTSVALCYYFSASRNVKANEVDQIKTIAKEVFDVFHSDFNTSKIMNISAMSMVKEDTCASLGLIRLQAILEETFPSVCPKKVPIESEEEEKATELLRLVEEQYEESVSVYDYSPQGFMASFSQYMVSREKFLVLLKTGFVAPIFLAKEVFFEEFPFEFLLNVPLRNPQRETNALFELDDAMFQFDEERALVPVGFKPIPKFDYSECIARARLFLQRFYDHFPEMLVFQETAVEKQGSFPKITSPFFDKQLKIISLWVAVKSIDDTVEIKDFVSTLTMQGYFNISFENKDIQDWLLPTIDLFMDAIEQKVGFEDIDVERAIKIYENELA